MEYNKNVELAEWTMEFDKIRIAGHTLFAFSKEIWENIKNEFLGLVEDFEGMIDDENQNEILKSMMEKCSAKIESPRGFIPGKQICFKKNGEEQCNFFHQPLWKYPIGPREEYWTIDGGYPVESKTKNVKTFIQNIAKWDKDESETNKIKAFIDENKNAVLVDVISSCSLEKAFALKFNLPKDAVVELKNMSFSFVDVPADYPMHTEIRYEDQVLKADFESIEINYRTLSVLEMEEK